MSQDYNVPNKWLRQVAGCSQYFIEKISAKYDYARETDSGFPVGGFIKALAAELESTSKMLGTKIGADEKEVQIEHELKKENVLSKRIVNQTKLSVLIPKLEASERVKRILRATMDLIKNAIKNSAPRLLNIAEKRDVETVLTEEWNKAVDLLKESCQNISWEQDGSARLLETRLRELEADDPEFTEMVKERVEHEESKSLEVGK